MHAIMYETCGSGQMGPPFGRASLSCKTVCCILLGPVVVLTNQILPESVFWNSPRKHPDEFS